MCRHAELLQSCLTLCNPMDCSLPGSSVHGMLQARILEWVAMPSSRRSSQPRDQTRVSYVSGIGRQVLYYQRHLGRPNQLYFNYKKKKNHVSRPSPLACVSHSLGPLEMCPTHSEMPRNLSRTSPMRLTHSERNVLRRRKQERWGR